eukprot:3103582-Pyramimonas_sp.AAC.1
MRVPRSGGPALLVTQIHVDLCVSQSAQARGVLEARAPASPPQSPSPEISRTLHLLPFLLE